MAEGMAFNAGQVYATLQLRDKPFLAALARSNAMLDTHARAMEARFGRIDQAMGRVSTTMLAIGTVGVAGMAVASRYAMDFDKQMHNVNSITGLTEKGLRDLSGEVRSLSQELGSRGPAELARGLYDVASSGFYAGEGIKVLRAASVAAIAGMSDTATGVRAVTGVLNAYGQKADQARDVSDVMFQTVNLGVVTFGELAQNIGEVVATASGAKVEFGEVGAAIATMTKGGIIPPEAVTSLNRFLITILEGNKGLQKLWKQAGYESGYAVLQAKGLAGAVEIVAKATGGEATALQKLFPEMRAFRGALSLTRQEGKAFAGDLAQIADPVARLGAAQRAFAEQQKSDAYRWDKMKVAWENAAVSLGSKLLPMTETATEDLTALAEVVGKVPPGLLAVGTGAALAVGGLAKLAQVSLHVTEGIIGMQAARALNVKTLDLETAAVVRHVEVQATDAAAAVQKAEADFAKADAAVRAAAATEGDNAALVENALANRTAAASALTTARAEEAEAAAMLQSAKAADAASVSFWRSLTLGQKFGLVATALAAVAAVLYGTYRAIENEAGRASDLLAAQADREAKAAEARLRLAQATVEKQREQGRSLRQLGEEYGKLTEAQKKAKPGSDEYERQQHRINEIAKTARERMEKLAKAVGDGAPKWDGTAKSVLAFADALVKADKAAVEAFKHQAEAQYAQSRAEVHRLRAQATREGQGFWGKARGIFEQMAIDMAENAAGQTGVEPLKRATPEEREKEDLKRYRKRATRETQLELVAAEQTLEANAIQRARARKMKPADLSTTTTTTTTTTGMGTGAGAASKQTPAEKLRGYWDRLFEHLDVMLNTPGQAPAALAEYVKAQAGLAGHLTAVGEGKKIAPFGVVGKGDTRQTLDYLQGRINEAQRILREGSEQTRAMAEQYATAVHEEKVRVAERGVASARMTQTIRDDMEAQAVLVDMLGRETVQRQTARRKAYEAAQRPEGNLVELQREQGELLRVPEQELTDKQRERLAALNMIFAKYGQEPLARYKQAMDAAQAAEAAWQSALEGRVGLQQELMGQVQGQFEADQVDYQGAVDALDWLQRKMAEAGSLTPESKARLAQTMQAITAAAAEREKQLYDWGRHSAAMSLAMIDGLKAELQARGLLTVAIEEQFEALARGVADAEEARLGAGIGQHPADHLKYEREKLERMLHPEVGVFFRPEEKEAQRRVVRQLAIEAANEYLGQMQAANQATEEHLRTTLEVGHKKLTPWYQLTVANRRQEAEAAARLYQDALAEAQERHGGGWAGLAAMTEEERQRLRGLARDAQAAGDANKRAMMDAAQYAREQWERTWKRFSEVVWNISRDRGAARSYFKELFEGLAEKQWQALFRKRKLDKQGKEIPGTGGYLTEMFRDTGQGKGPLGGLGDWWNKILDKNKWLPKAGKAAGSLMALYQATAGAGTTSGTEGAVTGGLSGLSAGVTIAEAFGLKGAALGPWAAVGAIVGGLWGFMSAHKRAEEQAQELRRRQLAELKRLNNALRPVSDYFNRGAFGALTNPVLWGMGLQQAWAAEGARGIR